MDQDIPKVNSHHPIFYGAPIVPILHFSVFISPSRGCAVSPCVAGVVVVVVVVVDGVSLSLNPRDYGGLFQKCL